MLIGTWERKVRMPTRDFVRPSQLSKAASLIKLVNNY
jgi:hypothetical protein